MAGKLPFVKEGSASTPHWWQRTESTEGSGYFSVAQAAGLLRGITSVSAPKEPLLVAPTLKVLSLTLQYLLLDGSLYFYHIPNSVRSERAFAMTCKLLLVAVSPRF